MYFSAICGGFSAYGPTGPAAKWHDPMGRKGNYGSCPSQNSISVQTAKHSYLVLATFGLESEVQANYYSFSQWVVPPLKQIPIQWTNVRLCSHSYICKALHRPAWHNFTTQTLTLEVDSKSRKQLLWNCLEPISLNWWLLPSNRDAPNDLRSKFKYIQDIINRRWRYHSISNKDLELIIYWRLRRPMNETTICI